MNFPMTSKVYFLTKDLVTIIAFVRFLSSMDSDVLHSLNDNERICDIHHTYMISIPYGLIYAE